MSVNVAMAALTGLFLALLSGCTSTSASADEPSAANYLIVGADGQRNAVSHDEFWSEVTMIPPTVPSYHIRTLQFMEPRPPQPGRLVVSYESSDQTRDASLTLSEGSLGGLGGGATESADVAGQRVHVQTADTGGHSSVVWEACGLSALVTMGGAGEEALDIAAPFIEGVVECE